MNQNSNKILINMLNLANLTKARCEQFLGKHKNSLDTYIYRYHGVEFPSSFAFFFLNSISTSLLPNYKMSKKKGKFEFFKEIDHSHQNNFFKILSQCSDQSIKERLILPCLEHHILTLIKISNFENLHNQEALINEYIEMIVPGHLEEISYLEEYQLSEDKKFSEFHIKRIENYQLMVNSIKEFFPILEILRKIYMKNFVAPHETFKLPILNSKKEVLFSKDFVKRNLNINKYNDLILMNIQEDNMADTFNKDDLALIIKFNGKVLPKLLDNGIYALNMNDKIIIRRLQFLELSKRTLVNIISDNKRYSEQQVSYDEIDIYGEVVWKCNNFKDIQFNKYNTQEQNLFSSEKDFEIPKFLNNNYSKKEIA